MMIMAYVFQHSPLSYSTPMAPALLEVGHVGGGIEMTHGTVGKQLEDCLSYLQTSLPFGLEQLSQDPLSFHISPCRCSFIFLGSLVFEPWDSTLCFAVSLHVPEKRVVENMLLAGVLGYTFEPVLTILSNPCSAEMVGE